MPQFTPPNVMFLNTWAQPERDFVRRLADCVHQNQMFARVAEPCAGAFVVSSLFADVGFPREQIEASDVWLFSALLGKAIIGQPLDDLGLTIEGDPLPLTGDPLYDSAEVLYQQVRVRLERIGDREYWKELRHDFATRKPQHVGNIVANLNLLKNRLNGISYTPRDVWAHLYAIKDDPNTIAVLNPPTYRGAYEKFFESNGRIAWNVPPYQIWNPAAHQAQLFEESKSWPATIVVQQQAAPLKSVDQSSVIYARDLSPGQVVYLWSNKPDKLREVLDVTGVPRNMTLQHQRLPYPILPPDHNVNVGSTCDIVPISAGSAAYYKELWLHRITPVSMGNAFAVIVDGYLAGIAGLADSILTTPYSTASVEKLGAALIMVFALGPKHDVVRLTRLATMLCTSRAVVDRICSPWSSVRADSLVTVEYTKHAEAKGLRGIMKLLSRDVDKVKGPKLIYKTPIRTLPIQDIFEDWYDRECKWQTNTGK